MTYSPGYDSRNESNRENYEGTTFNDSEGKSLFQKVSNRSVIKQFGENRL